MTTDHFESSVGFTAMIAKAVQRVDAHYEVSKGTSNRYRDLDLLVDYPGPDRVQYPSIIPQILKMSIPSSFKMRIGVEMLSPIAHGLKFVESSAIRRAMGGYSSGCMLL